MWGCANRMFTKRFSFHCTTCGNDSLKIFCDITYLKHYSVEGLMHGVFRLTCRVFSGHALISEKSLWYNEKITAEVDCSLRCSRSCHSRPRWKPRYRPSLTPECSLSATQAGTLVRKKGALLLSGRESLRIFKGHRTRIVIGPASWPGSS